MMKRNTLQNRILSLVLSLAMCLGLMMPALALAAETASTIQMKKTTGDVTVSNSTGRSLSTRENMRLYNGYDIESGEKSYAWFNLDSTKIHKLDAVSEAEVRKSGKKLELLLNSGNLFFNVTEPLKEDESLNIRTSTMVVGIRGTCGWVKLTDRWTTLVYILEGSVECRVCDPVTGQTKTTVLKGGETASFVVYPQDREGDKCDILRESFTEEDIDGFVLVELVKDPGLCEKIFDDSGLDVLGHYDEKSAQKRLEQDQAVMAEKLAQITKEQDKQEHNISVEPVWNQQSQPSSTSGGSSSGGGSSTTDPVVTTVSMPKTAQEVQNLLDANTSVTIQPSTTPAENTLTIEDIAELKVEAGKTLTLADDGTNKINVDVTGGNTLSVDGTMIVSGDLTNNGTLNVTSGNTLRVGGSLTNNAAMNLTQTGRVIVTSNFAQSGNLSMRVGTKIQAKTCSGTTSTTRLDQSEAVDTDGYYTVTPKEGFLWEYDNDTTPTELRIFANQKMGMPDYTYDISTWTVDTPWYAYRNTIKSVVISDDITSIGDYAFCWCTSLTSVTIPSGVTSIGEGAFRSSGLTSVTIEKGVTSIGDWAFSFCDDLAEIQIPDSVTSIGNVAFYGCTSLTSVDIPDSVTSIGDWAFYDCDSLTKFAVGEANPNYKTDENGKALLNKDGTKFIRCVGGFSGSYAIPDTVTSIGDCAFKNCSGLTGELNIPSGVTSIGDGAFDGCSGLTGALNIPSGVTSIGDRAFDECTSLTSVTIPSSVTSIGDYAFNGCSALTGALNIPSGVTSIGDYAFCWCTSLTSVTIPDSVTSIGDCAFKNCSGLTGELNIPSGVTSIGDGAFSSCNKLTTINLSGNSNFQTDGGGQVLLSKDGTKLICCVGGFSGSYTIPSSVTSIGHSVFDYCYALTSVTIPSSVTSIGDQAFFHCPGLTDVYYTGTEEQWNAITIGSLNENLTDATIHYESTGDPTPTT